MKALRAWCSSREQWPVLVEGFFSELSVILAFYKMDSRLPGPNSTWSFTDMSRTPKVIFLFLFMVTSFAGSVFIISVLLHNVKLRSVQNLLIANMCVVCIVDSVCNMALVMGALIANEWIYGAFVCKMNNFFMNLVAFETLLMLTALSTDQYFFLRFSCKYETWLSSRRIRSIMAYFWLQSVTFSIPFLTGAVSSTFKLQFSMCTVSDTSLPFLYVTLLVCFVGPVIMTIVIHIVNALFTCKLKHLQTTSVSEKNYMQMLNDTRQQAEQPELSSYTLVLLAMWLILYTPFIVTSYITQYTYIQQAGDYSVSDYHWETSAAFAWMRFSYSALFPLVTFLFKKVLRHSVKECLLCRRHNSIVDMNVLGIVSDVAKSKKRPQVKENEAASRTKERDKEISETPSSLSFNVPVLFATSSGICIEDSSIENVSGESEHSRNSGDVLELKGKTLDISYPDFEYADVLLGETSDYDSSCETDQYSSSQPVSACKVLGALHRTRSMSNPEIISRHDKTNIEYEIRDIGGTFIADSGLDLSGATASSLGGTVNSKVAKVHELVVESLPSAEEEDAGSSRSQFPDANAEKLIVQQHSGIGETSEPNNSFKPPSDVHIMYQNLENSAYLVDDIKREKQMTIKRDGSACSQLSPPKRQSNISGRISHSDSSTSKGQLSQSNQPFRARENRGDKSEILPLELSEGIS